MRHDHILWLDFWSRSYNYYTCLSSWVITTVASAVAPWAAILCGTLILLGHARPMTTNLWERNLQNVCTSSLPPVVCTLLCPLSFLSINNEWAPHGNSHRHRHSHSLCLTHQTCVAWHRCNNLWRGINLHIGGIAIAQWYSDSITRGPYFDALPSL